MNQLSATNQLAHSGSRSAGAFGYTLYLLPDEACTARINAARQLFAGRYGTYSLPMQPPMLGLASFEANEVMEDTLIRWLQRIAGQFQAFDLRLNNFGGIPPHTIYARVQDPNLLRALVGQLRRIDPYLKASEFKGLQPEQRFGIPVAAHIMHMVYDKAMQYFAAQELCVDFSVQQMILVREAHGLPARQVQVFSLGPVWQAA
jgi:hypothetical protein